MIYHSARFAARETRDIEVLEWMFDRKAVPLSLAMTEEFSEEYYAMTDFIWPDGWKNEVSFKSSDTHIPDAVHRAIFRNAVSP